jgi:hypothetical protein
MPGPARDLRENREHKVRRTIILPRRLTEEVRRFKNANVREIDNASHAVRVLIDRALAFLRDGGAAAEALRTLPNGPHEDRKEILLPTSTYEAVRQYRYDHSERVESDTAAIRELVWLGLHLERAAAR